jgi:hypothetical protein
MRARLHVQRSRIGFYREGTHALCDAAATRQLLPATIDVLSRFAGEIGRLAGIDGAEIALAGTSRRPSASCTCGFGVRLSPRRYARCRQSPD